MSGKRPFGTVRKLPSGDRRRAPGPSAAGRNAHQAPGAASPGAGNRHVGGSGAGGESERLPTGNAGK